MQYLVTGFLENGMSLVLGIVEEGDDDDALKLAKRIWGRHRHNGHKVTEMFVDYHYVDEFDVPSWCEED